MPGPIQRGRAFVERILSDGVETVNTEETSTDLIKPNNETELDIQSRKIDEAGALDIALPDSHIVEIRFSQILTGAGQDVLLQFGDADGFYTTDVYEYSLEQVETTGGDLSTNATSQSEILFGSFSDTSTRQTSPIRMHFGLPYLGRREIVSWHGGCMTENRQASRLNGIGHITGSGDSVERMRIYQGAQNQLENLDAELIGWRKR